MATPRPVPTRLVLVCLGLAAASCVRPVERTETRAADAPAAAAALTAEPAGGAVAMAGDFFGASLALADAQGRALECRGLAKAGGRALVMRNADNQRFVVESARLSAESRAALAAYADTRAAELAAFEEERDYAAAKRSVKVEMISAGWCGWCAKTKEFFAKEKIPYEVFDYESQGGRRRQAEWGSTGLPTVKIGGEVIRGFGEESYRNALLAEYRKTLAPAGGS